MIALDVGDDDIIGSEAKERVVALIGLHHQPSRPCPPGSGTELIHHAAHDERWIPANRFGHQCRHGGGGGLTMGSRDRQCSLPDGDGFHHLRSSGHRQPCGQRRLEFNVAGLHSGGHGHHIRPLHMVTAMSRPHGETLSAQTIEGGRVHLVRARDGVAHGSQDVSHRTHGRAPCGHHMYALRQPQIRNAHRNSSESMPPMETGVRRGRPPNQPRHRRHRVGREVVGRQPCR